MHKETAGMNTTESNSNQLGKEAAQDGVVVSAVYPGGVDTDFRDLERQDYLSAETVAESIINLLQMNPEAAMHELVLRPHIEQNY